MLILYMLFWGLPNQTWAQKKVAFIFGGNEPDKEVQKTVFDVDYYETVRVLIQHNYQIHAFFNGENKETMEKWVTPMSRDPRVYWQPANRKAALEALNKLKLNSKDQLLIYIMGHGSASPHSLKHGVIMNGDEILTLADIKSHLDRPNLSEVNQIVVDASCFSGHTLVLAKSNRCVLTSSHKDTQGYYAFPWQLKKHFELAKNYGTSKSVLDVYMRARRFMVSSHPQISSFTPQSSILKILHFLTRYQLTIEEYIYFSDKTAFCDYCYIKTSNKLDKELSKALENLEDITIPLPEYEKVGIKLTALEFVKTHKKLLEISNMEASDMKKRVSEIQNLIRSSKYLHEKLVKFERALYELEWAMTSVPDNDPCASMSL